MFHPRDGNRQLEGTQLALLPSLEADARCISRPPKINPRAFDELVALLSVALIALPLVYFLLFFLCLRSQRICLLESNPPLGEFLESVPSEGRAST